MPPTTQVTTYDSRVTLELPRVVEISVVQLEATAANRVTPDIQRGLAGLTRDSIDANDFINRLRETPEFAALVPGARAMSASSPAGERTMKFPLPKTQVVSR